jgi:beta-glucanase (GH16 family)
VVSERSRTNGIAALTLAATLTGCGGGDAGNPTDAAQGVRPAGYSLVWSDEFNSPGALNSTYWTYDLGAPLLGGTVWGNSEQQYYTSDAANVRIENGHLLIQPVAGVPMGAPTTQPPLLATSARVKTDKTAFYTALRNQPYGFYEIRADIPCVAGAWPAIWMMGKDGGWPDRGELDIMEWFGRYFAAQPDQVQSGVHTADNFGGNSLFGKVSLNGVCQGFHRFQLLWQTDRVAFYVDDRFIFQYNKPVNGNSNNWPFDQPAHLLLNVAVGGNLGGSVNLATIPAMGMKVDYVRVWQPLP